MLRQFCLFTTIFCFSDLGVGSYSFYMTRTHYCRSNGYYRVFMSAFFHSIGIRIININLYAYISSVHVYNTHKEHSKQVGSFEISYLGVQWVLQIFIIISLNTTNYENYIFSILKKRIGKHQTSQNISAISRHIDSGLMCIESSS